MGAVDFLQEHHIGGHTAHRFAQFRQDEAPVQGGETLVGVDRQHGEVADPVENLGLLLGRLASCFAGLRAVHGNTPSAGRSPGAVARSLSR